MYSVGFDIGSSTSFIALGRAGGIETIANEYSDRNTPTFVSFSNKLRALGTEAKQKQIVNVQNTFFGFTNLIGRKYKDPCVQRELARLPYTVSEAEDGKVLFHVNFQDKTQLVTCEQLYAMHLTKLKQVTEANLGTKIVDVVLNVPCGATQSQRNAILDAAQIAGLNVMRILNDTTSSALNYGFFNKELPEAEAKPKIVAFVDMGYSNLQVSIVAYNKGKLRVLSSKAAKIGGRDFDDVIFRRLCSEFQQNFQLNVAGSKKAVFRLLLECEKMKKLMSANSTEIPLNIECFMEDKDVRARMKREEFEKLAEPLLLQVEQTLAEVLSEAKLSGGAADISAVEIIGGSTRIPAVKAAICKVFVGVGGSSSPVELRTSLNADEAVARGAAIQGAILSPLIRVAIDFTIQDQYPYSVSLCYKDEAADKFDSTEVFPRGHAFPFSRQLTFYRKDSFEVQAMYTNPEQVGGAADLNNLIGIYNISDIVEKSNGDMHQVKLKVRINPNGIFTCSQAQIVEKVEKQVEVPMEDSAVASSAKKDAATGKEEQQSSDKNPAMDVDPNDPKKDSSGENDNLKNGDDEQKEEESPQQQATSAAAGEDGKSKDASASGAATDSGSVSTSPPAKKMATKWVNRTIDLPVSTTYTTGLSKEFLNKYTEFENSIIMDDRLEKERSSAKNAVEEYVYEMKELLFGDMEEFITDDEQESFKKDLDAAENWVYDEQNLNKQMYIDRLAELKKSGEAFRSRMSEAVDRPAAIEEFGRACNTIRKTLELIEAKDEKYNHLTEDDIKKLKSILNEKETWFNEVMNKQNSKQKNEDPIVLASTIRINKDTLETAARPIVNKPKPKVEEPPPPPPATSQDNASNSNEASSGNTAGGPTDKPDDMDLD